MQFVIFCLIDLESLLRHPILSRVGAAQQVAMICQAVQGASSWEKEAYELLQNEDTTTVICKHYTYVHTCIRINTE